MPSRYLLELLHQGQYEQLAQLVREFTGMAASGSGQTTADLLRAASWMCEACIEGHQEAGWHEEALSRLNNREHELVRMLGRVLSVLDDVAAGRKLDKQKLRPLADGRILTGKQALAAGLVDELGNFEVAVERAAELAGKTGTPVPVFPKKSGGSMLSETIS